MSEAGGNRPREEDGHGCLEAASGELIVLNPVEIATIPNVKRACRIHRRRRLIALGLLVSLAISGCALEKHNWTYSLSRQVYSSKNLSSLASAKWEGGGTMVGIALLGLVFVLPVVIDTAILPVTVTHDHLVAR